MVSDAEPDPVSDETHVELDRVVVARSVLAGPGGPFPTSHDGQPVRPYEPPPTPEEYADEQWPDPPPPPATGWRLIGTVPNDPPVPVYAVPAGTREQDWLVVRLYRQGPAWNASRVMDERVRPIKERRGRGLVLDWGTAPLGPDVELGLDELMDLHVRLTRDGAPLAWDRQDMNHVVGWVNKSDRELPYQPRQAFVGMGTAIGPDDDEALLPIRWITDDVGSLPSGDYVLTAALAAFNLKTAPRAVRLVR